MTDTADAIHPEANADAEAAAVHDEAVRLTRALSAAIGEHRPCLNLALGALLGLFRNLAETHGAEPEAVRAMYRAAADMQHHMALRQVPAASVPAQPPAGAH